MKTIVFTVLFCLLYSCNSASNHEELITQKKERVAELFTKIKDWKNNKELITQQLAEIENTFPQLNIRYTKEEEYFTIYSDSLAYLDIIKNQIEKIKLEKQRYKQATFYVDTTVNGKKLLNYILYPDPTQNGAYSIDVLLRAQE